MDIRKFCVKDINIKTALRIINETENGSLMVVDDDNVLLGSLTDGDVRRFIVRNGDINASIHNVMNRKPIFLYECDSDKARKLVLEDRILMLPILNKNKQVVDIKLLRDYYKTSSTVKNKLENTDVVINAGGEGSRLKPMTNVIPKPLIPIGDTSVIERIIHKFVEHGIDEFNIIVNYKKELIKSYFNELNKSYITNMVEEEKPLGTIGGLCKLKHTIKNTIFFSNCDIIIETDYYDVLKFHRENKNKITIVSCLKNNKIPYGVVNVNDKGEVVKIKEKPEYDFLAITGLYVFEPDIIDNIADDEFLHATDLINAYIDKGEKVGVYPIEENSWLDMGEFSEMNRMLGSIIK